MPQPVVQKKDVIETLKLASRLQRVRNPGVEAGSTVPDNWTKGVATVRFEMNPAPLPGIDHPRPAPSYPLELHQMRFSVGLPISRGFRGEGGQFLRDKMSS